MLLNRIEFKKDFRTFKKGDLISFYDRLTVIVGDNGTGKSTLIGAIRNLFDNKWTMSHCSSFDNILTNEKNKDIKIGYFDVSLDLHTINPEIDFSNFEVYKKCRMSSSGEGSTLQMKEFLFIHADKSLIIIDEPERGLSLKRQKHISGLIKEHMSKNPEQQIIITTHSETLMDLSLNGELLSLNHNLSYIKKKQYIDFMNTSD